VTVTAALSRLVAKLTAVASITSTKPHLTRLARLRSTWVNLYDPTRRSTAVMTFNSSSGRIRQNVLVVHALTHDCWSLLLSLYADFSIYWSEGFHWMKNSSIRSERRPTNSVLNLNLNSIATIYRDRSLPHSVGRLTVRSFWNSIIVRYGKGKGFPYSIPSVGPGADPGVQAVSPQVTVSHAPGGRLPLLSARPAITSPAAEHHRPFGRYQVILLGNRGT